MRNSYLNWEDFCFIAKVIFLTEGKKMLMKYLIFVAFLAVLSLVTAGCVELLLIGEDEGGAEVQPNPTPIPTPATVGDIEINVEIGGGDAVIDTSTLTAINITVKGPGITTPITSTSTVAPTATFVSISITVEKIPLGPNRVVIIEAVGATSIPSLVGNPTLYGLIPDLVAGDNIVLINQGSTPAARIIDGLLIANLESKAFNISASVIFAVSDRVFGTDSTNHRPTGSDYLIDPLTGADEFVSEVVSRITSLTKATILIVESDLLPIVTGISPTSGSANDSISISGYGFDGTTATNNTVTFGSTSATVASAAGTSLGVTVPNVPGGSTTVVVTVSSGSDSTTFTSVPKIDSISPTSQVIGNSITIIGTGFDASAVANNTIKFGTASATVTSVNATSLTVIVPSGLSGTTSVTVTVGGQESASVSFMVLDLGS